MSSTSINFLNSLPGGKYSVQIENYLNKLEDVDGNLETQGAKGGNREIPFKVLTEAKKRNYKQTTFFHWWKH